MKENKKKKDMKRTLFVRYERKRTWGNKYMKRTLHVRRHAHSSFWVAEFWESNGRTP
jgi:hypothetical protein